MTIEAGAFTQPQIEVKHAANHDLVINHDAISKEELIDLVPQLMNGLPATWNNFVRYRGDESVHLFRDNPANPKYFAKVKKNVSPENLKRAYRVAPYRNPEYLRWQLAHQSLLNEMKISPIVVSVLETEDAQRLAENFGFENIALVKPLIGLVDKRSGHKTMVYPWVQGYTTVSGTTRQKNKMSILSTGNAKGEILEDKLEALFQRNSIEPHDLGSNQFIADNKTIYLIDIEGYWKL